LLASYKVGGLKRQEKGRYKTKRGNREKGGSERRREGCNKENHLCQDSSGGAKGGECLLYEVCKEGREYEGRGGLLVTLVAAMVKR